MSLLAYRNATLDDLPQIVAIYNSTIPSRLTTADTEPVTVASKEAWFYQHNPAHRPLWVIEAGENEMVGWVSFTSFYGRPAYKATAEISIYMAAEQRGKGYGKEILKYCLDKAISLGIKTLLGFIFAHNEPSLKLFRHLGFEEWAHLPNVAVLDDAECSLKILGKRIAD